MKLSEFIKYLQEIEKNEGDRNIWYVDFDNIPQRYEIHEDGEIKID